MTTAQLLALGIVLAALAYFFLGGDGAAVKGKHGLAMLKAGQQAGMHGAAVLIEERLGEAEAKRFIRNFSEGIVEPSTPPPATPPKS